MKIGLDYDETYTEAPMLFKLFVLQAIQEGHEVTFVTYRYPHIDNDDIHTDAADLGNMYDGCLVNNDMVNTY